MAKPILAHVGLHKTATTWLQERLFEPASKAGQIRYCDNRPLLRGGLGKPEIDCFDPAALRAQLEADLNATIGDEPIVISDEIIAGLPFHHMFRGRIKLKRLAETLPEAHVLITIRAQVPLIYSAWGHYLRGGNTASLAAFVHQPEGRDAALWDPILNRSAYDYLTLLDWCEDVFGAGRVIMVPMESMTRAPESFLRTIEDCTGLRLPMPVAAEKQVNTAWSHPALNLLRQVNRLSDVDARWQVGPFARIGNRLADRFDRFIPEGRKMRTKAAALALIEKAIGDTYRDSNRALSARLGVDLGALGYSV